MVGYILLAGVALTLIFGPSLTEVSTNGNALTGGLLYLMQIVLMLLPFLFLLSGRGPVNLKEAFMIRKTHWFYWLVLPVLAYGVYIVGVTLIVAGLMELFQTQDIPGVTGQQPSPALFFGEDAAGLAVMLFASIIAAPIVEEIVFRGFMMNSLMKYVGGPAAIVITSALFALQHLQFQVFFGLFAVGIVFGWIAWYSKSIIPSIILHALNNSVAMAVLILAPELLSA